MTEFTKDCLRFCVRVGTDRPETFNIASRDNPDANIASLAAFALALMERAENAEAERDELFEVIEAWDGNVPADVWPEVAAYNAAVRRALERGGRG